MRLFPLSVEEVSISRLARKVSGDDDGEGECEGSWSRNMSPGIPGKSQTCWTGAMADCCQERGAPDLEIWYVSGTWCIPVGISDSYLTSRIPIVKYCTSVFKMNDNNALCYGASNTNVLKRKKKKGKGKVQIARTTGENAVVGINGRLG